jgi:hypothetical protein
MPSAYFDTNIISGLAKGEYSEDVALALVQLTALSKNGRVDLHTSEIAEDELALIPPRYRKQHLVIYNLIKNTARPANRTQHQYITGGGMIIAWRRPTGNAPLLIGLEALIPAKKSAAKIQARSRDIAHLHRFNNRGSITFSQRITSQFFATKSHFLHLASTRSLRLNYWRCCSDA